MARPKNPAPVYKLHSATGQARCWVNGQWVYLGKYGALESKAEFARVCAELSSTTVESTAVATEKVVTALTVDELLLGFLKHADRHYRRSDGTPTGHIVEIKNAVKPLHRLYGHTLAKDFGPRALKAVRDEMVKLNWCRRQVNDRIGKIRRAFKWGVEEELVPATVLLALQSVKGLEAGRCRARETEPIGPVDSAIVEVTLPHLPRPVRGLVEFQILTGCRPGEACRLRVSEIDTTGSVWLFRPDQHKTRHKSKDRVISIGPKAQELLKPFITGNSDTYLFDPRTVASRPVGERYTTHSLSVAVRRACVRAGVAHWHPNQLRHTFGTTVRKEHGLEAAQVLLGHERADITQIYAERNLALAVQIAKQVG